MNPVPATFKHAVEKRRSQHLLRKRMTLEEKNATRIVVKQQSLHHFCSNDYLNLAQHPTIKKAFIAGIQRYGTGSGSSPLVSGYCKPHAQFEEACAAFLNRDRALLFNSGYHANLAVMTTYANKNSVIIADKSCHASIMDGIVLSRARFKRYAHHHLEHAEQLLQREHAKNTPLVLVTESVFSMEGTIVNIKKLAALATQHQAFFMVDDAHGIGVLGEQGQGICAHYQLSQHDVPCLITPLGKSFASLGAIVSGSHENIEALLQLSKTYCYSTLLPPALACAALAALNIIQQENWRRHQLQHLIRFFITEAAARNIPLSSLDHTPIKSIRVGSNEAALNLQEKLMHAGFYVSCIRPPTVPVGSARIRISLNCMHSEKHITELLDLIKKYNECL
jgi:8-amino-7-oxononanoate synthase